mgnify:CR=1 FL=1
MFNLLTQIGGEKFIEFYARGRVEYRDENAIRKPEVSLQRHGS